MTQVIVPTTLGGSGIAYSDDGTGARDMRAGGHRQWLLPMVSEQIAAAQTAVNAAASTVGAASTQASSTTSLTIGTGTQSLTVEPAKNIIPGMPVRIASTATPANRMDGTVVSYTSGTGALVVSVDRVNGSGSESSWRVFLTGAGISTSDVTGGAGAAAITTATTLVAASERVRPVAMTTDAQAVTLPDATTLSEGGPVFVLPNTGSRPFILRANGGTMLSAILPGGVAECYLRDNSTAAGSWTVSGRDLSPAAIIGDFTLTSTLTQNVDASVRLTDNLSLHFARNASGHPFVVAVDSTPGASAVGTPVLIVASNFSVQEAYRVTSSKAFIWLSSTGGGYNIAVSGVTCTVSTNTGGAPGGTFTGLPTSVLLGASSDILVTMTLSSGVIAAGVKDLSGVNPGTGTGATIVASGGQALVGLYEVSDTTALALYVDDSGTPGTPFSIRGVVLSLSGTTITVGTSAGLNDVISSTGTNGPPACQHAAGLYTLGYYQASGTLLRAVGITVSGTTVTFGTPVTVETASLGNQDFAQYNANRFQPNMFPLDATRALFTYGFTTGSTPSRHVVLTNSAGAVTAGTILYNLWLDQDGGNFPQAADGFLAMQEQSTSSRISNVTISGTTLTVTGTLLPPGVSFPETESRRFGLSGGIRAIQQGYQNGPSISAPSVWNAFRLTQGAGPRYLGAFNLPNFNGAQPPLEVAANKVVITSSTLSQNGSATAAIKIAILEFAA